ncbi:cytochrome P450 [Streptomyces sp. NA02950]|uniref:cytochrome P450 n=1 Tax=Streptomyces sp. NA02950 TaxID=2742137 RepID=UPI0020CAFF42|nr:cytochrome P450 [Streptomyces sp. NA02950]
MSRYQDVCGLLRSKLSVDDRHLAPGPMADIIQSVYGDKAPRMNGLSMLDQDPPHHTRLRRLVSKAFTARSVSALEPRVAARVGEALDRVAEAGRADLVAELAFPLPSLVISELLGMPPIDQIRLRELTSVMMRAVELTVDPQLLAEVAAAEDELLAMAHEAIAWKRNRPGEDLLTALIAAEEDGDVLSDAELAAQVMLLYMAGHETTVGLISNGLLALLNHPGQLAVLRKRPDLIANAVEEFLRYDGPSHMAKRITLEPVCVGDKVIPRGAMVILSLASANRDESFWGADAHELRLDRANAQQHVGFSVGMHHCLGAALARLEGRVAISAVVRRFPGLALEEARQNGRMNLRGLDVLSVSV